MENSKSWNPEKKIFVLLHPSKAHRSIKGIIGYKNRLKYPVNSMEVPRKNTTPPSENCGENHTQKPEQ